MTMFYGTRISEAKPLKSTKLFESGEYATFHLSAAILESPEAQKGSVRLVTKSGKEDEVTIAVLSKDQC